MVLSDNNSIKRARLLILTAAVAAGIAATSGTAFAELGAVSERDMVLQAVALYEKLTGEEVAVPGWIAEACADTELGKAVVLGFVNYEDAGSLSEAISLRKQDALTVLYKTVIDFDDSFALTSEEVDEIMNGCYDNALIDEENRVGYAFMIKHGIISSVINTEPNKEINWNGCRVLIDNLYKLFSQNAVFNVGGVDVRIGANITTVTNILGEPARIDKGEYDYDWYVYNSDYSYFMMVGVENGRICAFYSNSATLSFDGIRIGSDINAAINHTENDGYRIYRDNGGRIDSVLYIAPERYCDTENIAPETAIFELTDMINANRARNGLSPLSISQAKSAEAQEMSKKAKYISVARDRSIEHVIDRAQHEIGYDTFSAYYVLNQNSGTCFDKSTHVIGIGTSVTDDNFRMVSIISAGSANDTVETDSVGYEAMIPAENVSEQEKQVPTTFAGIYELVEKSMPEVSEVYYFGDDDETDEQPVEDIASDGTATGMTSEAETEADTAVKNKYINSGFDLSEYNGVIIEDGNDLAIEMEADGEYYVKVYSFEKDDYIVNSYISTHDGILTLGSELFEPGNDYAISICPSYDTSEPEEFVISYGTVPENAVEITSHENGAVLDNDMLELSWKSELYNDFIVDVYNEDGELMLSDIVSGSHSANIRNIKPGTYDVHISALRRGSTDFVKAETSINIEIKMPEPVISEYILEDGEKFYPIYEDMDMGLVYFYDEDIIDVTVTGANGIETTTKRKKITEKQVKATDYYRQLAAKQTKLEYFTGSDERDILVNEEDMSVITYDNMVLSDNIYGAAILSETRKYLGVPYLWGGTTPEGFDCSGLCQYVYKNVGLDISRVSQTQYLEGMSVSREELQPGDLVFFQKNGDVHHVGIYAGGSMMIHAPYTGATVRYDSIDEGTYFEQFCGGRRITKTDTEE